MTAPDIPPGGSMGQPIGIEIQGVYDGVCVWVDPDGSMRNRFRGEGSERERLTDDFIIRRTHAVGEWLDKVDETQKRMREGGE